MRTIVPWLAVATVALLATACGSSTDSEFGDGAQGGSGAGGDSNAFGAGSGAGGGGNGSGSGANGVGNVDPSSACATSSAGAEQAPVSLVFMIDRSGSMGGPDLGVRWNPVASGLQAFFADAKSSSIEASLAFFPIVSGKNSVCTMDSYAAPAVAMRALPDGSSFSAAFSATGPNGGTPTEPALSGALDYAKTIKAAGKNVAVVLATDGAPNDCNSGVSGVAAIAAGGAAAGIKTYVIGVGPNTGNLDAIAAGGGTTNAIMIPTSDPTQVSTDLRAAVGVIAASLLGCSYGLPAPPTGQQLDVNAVNVNYTPGGGALGTLPYSADCSNPGGWHYDNPANPSQIVMCSGICDTVTKDLAGGKVSIVFGCKTSGAEGGIPGASPK
ncbi:MAG: VWA domain-containing protein [Deltaproteobacteria bacterium]|nr:VWA domain-containing protein [Deltaproteobacteria bacterium]